MYDHLLSRRQALQRLTLALGGVISAPTLAGLLGGCRASGDEAAYAFRALDDAQRELATALADLVLPATDTPGASEAGVPAFMDKMLADWYTDEDRTRFLAGLAEVDARAEREHGRAFVRLDAATQTALLTAIDREAYAESVESNPNPWAGGEPPADSAANAQSGRTATGTTANNTAGQPSPEAERAADAAEEVQGGTAQMEERQQQEVGQAGGNEPGSGEAGGDPNARPPAEAAPAAPPFFRTFKELVLAGYYTSEIGATQELQWLAAPGRYDGNAPLADVGRAWA